MLIIKFFREQILGIVCDIVFIACAFAHRIASNFFTWLIEFRTEKHRGISVSLKHLNANTSGVDSRQDLWSRFKCAFVQHVGEMQERRRTKCAGYTTLTPRENSQRSLKPPCYLSTLDPTILSMGEDLNFSLFSQ